MIFLYPLYICLSLLWDPVEIRLWRWIFPPVLASLVYPPPLGPHGVIRGPQWRGPATSAFPRHHRWCIGLFFLLLCEIEGPVPWLLSTLTDASLYLVLCGSILRHIVWFVFSRLPLSPVLPLSLSYSSLLLLLNFSHSSAVLKTWVVP